MIGAWQAVWQQSLEAHGAHAIDQDLVVVAVAPATARDAAFLLMLGHRLVESDDAVDRRVKRY